MKDSSGRRVARARYADCKVLLRNAAVLLGFELAQLGDKPREKVASAFCESKQGAAQALEDGAGNYGTKYCTSGVQCSS